MPTYEFECPECHLIVEKYFHLYSEMIMSCDVCDCPMKKRFAATPAIFKGEGWAGKKSR